MSKTYRQWLSPASSDSPRSYVTASVEESQGSYDDHELSLGDCNRIVTLYFPASKKKRKAALAKLNKIQIALDMIWEALEEDE